MELERSFAAYLRFDWRSTLPQTKGIGIGSHTLTINSGMAAALTQLCNEVGWPLLAYPGKDIPEDVIVIYVGVIASPPPE